MKNFEACQRISFAPLLRNRVVGVGEVGSVPRPRYLVSVCTDVPLSTSHSLTVESKEAEASTRFMLGLLVPGHIFLDLDISISSYLVPLDST